MSQAMPCMGYSQAFCTSKSTAAGGAQCQWDPKSRQCMDVSSDDAAAAKPRSGGILSDLAGLAGSLPFGSHHVRAVTPDPSAARVGIPRIPLQPRPESSNDAPMDCKAFCASQGFDVSKMEASMSGLPASSGNCFCRQKGPLGFDSDSMPEPRPVAPLALQFPGSGP